MGEMPLPDDDATDLEEVLWKATGEVRWYRPPGGTDADIRLEQLYERVTGERDWRPVRTVLED